MKNQNYWCSWLLVLLLLQTIFIQLPGVSGKDVAFQVADLARGSVKGRLKHKPCDDPLHSWKCNTESSRGKSLDGSTLLNSQSQISFRPPPTVTPSTLTVSLPPNFFQTRMNQAKEKSIATSPIPVTAVKIRNSLKYNKCSHPFHSWQCDPGRSSRVTVPHKPATSSPFTKKMKNSHTTTTTTVPPVTFVKNLSTIKSVQSFNRGKTLFKDTSNGVPKMEKPIESNQQLSSSYKKCNHAFHSWLCYPPKRPIPKNIIVTTAPPIIRGKSLISRTTELPLLQKVPSKVLNNQIKNNTYDICSHAFHSWLCPTSFSKSQVTTYRPITTKPITKHEFKLTTPKTGKSLNKNSSIEEKTLRNLVPVTHGSKIRTQTSSAKTPTYDKCNHAFHAWMCQPKTKNKQIPRRNATNIGKSLETKSSSGVKETNTVRPTTFYSKTNMCSHPFHSWLCEKNKSVVKLVTQKPLVDLLRNKIVSNTERTTSKSARGKSFEHFKEANISNDNFCDKPENAPKCFPFKTTTTTTEQTTKYTTTRKATTTKPINTNQSINVRSKSIANVTNRHLSLKTPKTSLRNHWDGTNPCNHAFHSWLCKPLLPRLSPPFSPPRFNLKQENSVGVGKTLNNGIKTSTTTPSPTKTPSPMRTHRPTTTSSPTTTTRPKTRPRSMTTPRPTTSPRPTTTPSPTTISFFVDVTAVRTTARNTAASRRGKMLFNPSSKKKEDPCTHAFHSWRCFLQGHQRPAFDTEDIPNIRSLPLENENLDNVIGSYERIERNAKVSVTNKIKNDQNQTPYMSNSSPNEVYSGDSIEVTTPTTPTSFYNLKETLPDSQFPSHKEESGRPTQVEIINKNKFKSNSAVRRKRGPRLENRRKLAEDDTKNSYRMHENSFPVASHLKTWGVPIDMLSPLLFESKRIIEKG